MPVVLLIMIKRWSPTFLLQPKAGNPDPFRAGPARQRECKDTVRFASAALVGILGVAVFRPLLHGQFLFDDIGMILANPRLQRVHSLIDCFRFVFVPAKPVSNLLLALGQWAGDGGVFSQRALSLAAHGLAVALLVVNLRLLFRRSAGPWGEGSALAAGALFAVLPVHGETLAVAIFRQEILASLFTLAALALFQRAALAEGRRRRLALAGAGLFLGLAALSKEAYALIAPITLLSFLRAGEARRPRPLAAFILVLALVWGSLVLLLCCLPPTEYAYRGVVGWGVLSAPEHLRLAARSWAEGLPAVLAGRGLTFVPPRGRFGIGAGWGAVGVTISLLTLGAAIGESARRGGAWRAWGLSAGSAVLLYLAIPNLNLGSQHYWYFPSMGIVSLLVMGTERLFARTVRRPRAWAALALGAYALCLVAVAGQRQVPLRSRLSLALAELRAHPETAGNWHAVAGALLESPDPDAAAKAEPFLFRAKQMLPGDARVSILEKLYRERRGKN